MIELIEVSKRFGTNVILDKVSLRVEEGETLALFGPSGTGKSVTLKHIIGLIEPDEGDVIVDGVSIPNASRSALKRVRQRVGYVFQGSALFDSMDVEENILLGMPEQRVREDKAGCHERAMECLRLVNLERQVAHLYPSELSGGMQKRVAMARAIAGHQAYLLYDEPTTGLDPKNASIITNLIAHLQEELGVTGIIVTHDIENAFRVSDRVALLYEAQIHALGTVEEFLESSDPVVQSFVRPDTESVPTA